MKGDIEIVECHTNRETQCLEGFLVLEYDEEPSIREEDIHEKRKPEVDGYEDADTRKIVPSKYSQEKEIEGDDREELEDRERIGELENRQEIQESSGDSVLYSPLCVGMIEISFLSFGDEGDESSFCDGSEENIEDNPHSKSSENLPEIGSMHPLDDESEEFIFELEDVDIRERDLVEYDTTEPDGREKGREEIKFLEKGGGHDEFPSRTYDRFSEDVFPGTVSGL